MEEFISSVVDFIKSLLVKTLVFFNNGNLVELLKTISDFFKQIIDDTKKPNN